MNHNETIQFVHNSSSSEIIGQIVVMQERIDELVEINKVLHEANQTLLDRLGK